MATLIAFPTSGYNCYVAQAAATDYLSLSVGAASWTSATSAEKDAALVSATRALDKMIWQGEKADPDQALAFPRTGIVDREGNALPDDEIPPDITAACIELALALIVDSALYTAQDTSKNISSLKAGSAAITYFRPQAGGRFPPQVSALLTSLLGTGASSSSFMYAYQQSLCDLDDELSAQRGYRRTVF